MKAITPTCINNVSRIIGEELSGSKISIMFTNLGWAEADYSSNTKRIRICESVVTRCNQAHSAKPFFQVIEYVAQPQNYLEKPDNWRNLLSSINAQLMFFGYELNDAGRIVSAEVPSNYDEAFKRVTSIRKRAISSQLHAQVLKYCKEELMQENYFHSLFEASKGVLDRVRSLS